VASFGYWKIGILNLFRISIFEIRVFRDKEVTGPMEKMVNLRINGRQIRARSGQTVLEAAKGAGIDIPSLCHHPAITPHGACRICLVEIERQRTLQPACTFPVAEGMRVETESPKVVEERKFVLHMLFSERNHYCMFCEMSGDCELQALAYRYGMDHWTYQNPYPKIPVDGTRKYFIMDHNRCILCRRCIRACSELAANNTLGVKFRGAKTMISADMDSPFGESTCVACGTCLQVCPTGALVDRKSAYTGREAQVERTKSVCMFCSVGCGTEIISRSGRVLRVEGEWEEHNKGVLCVAGRFEPVYDNRERIKTPLLRKNGNLVPVPWEEAFDTITEKLKTTKATKIGAWTTSKTLNLTMSEFVAVFQGKIGAHVGVLEPTLSELELPVGGSLSELVSSDCILIVGADPLSDHRVLGYHIKRARMKGAQIILVSEDKNEISQFAHKKFPPEELFKAIKECQGCASPFVVYGVGTTQKDAEKLAMLKRKAHFIPVFPATNGYHAKVLGLHHGLSTDQIEMLYLLLEDIAPKEEWIKRAKSAKFLVVHTSYHGPITETADVVLPSLLWYEQEGSLYNLEGKKVAVRKSVPLPEGLIPENEVFTQLAARL
jgi:formate dehydrogenase major subunit